MTDRNFCPPSSTIGNEFRDTNINAMYGQREIQSGQYNNGFSTQNSSIGMSMQNGHFQPSRHYQTSSMHENSPTKAPQPSHYQSGNANLISSHYAQQNSYANIAASKTQQNSFDPFGYRAEQQRSAPVSYNIHQQSQRNLNFIPTTQPSHYIEEQQNPRQSTTQFSRPSQQQPYLPQRTGIPSFHPSGTNRTSFQQQNFVPVSSVTQTQQQTSSDFQQHQTLPSQSNTNTAGINFDMVPVVFDSGINNQNGNCHAPHAAIQHQMMNGNNSGDEFADFMGAGEMGTAMPAQYVLSNELLTRIENSPKKQALLELQIGLEQIAFDTTMNFNTWATVIKDRMVGRDPLSESDLRIAAEMVVEMAVVLDESQYNFSRLCHFLGANIDNFNQNVLLTQVNSFVTETNTFLSSQHLLNLAIFLAELYDKIEIKGVKSSQLAAHLFDQLHNVLKSTRISDQNIGVIVKVLKLVGRFLENDRGPQAMDEFITELEIASKNTSDLSKEKVQNLITLRGKQWGIVSETPVTSTQNQFPSVGILGPDGEQLTEDECNFLEENFDTFGNSPSGSLYNNPMEEDNVEDDYEKFLQATAIRAAEKALEKVSIDEDDESILSSPKFTGYEKNEGL